MSRIEVLTPPAGATFAGVMMGADEDLYLLATNAGYGFIAPLGEMYTKNKKGKSSLTVPSGASVLTPQRVFDIELDRVAVVTTGGYLLVYSAAELPVMNRGRGVKLVNIPLKKRQAGEEFVYVATTFQEGDTIVIHSGKRYFRLKPRDIDHYTSERGKRGRKLPRGFQHVQGLTIE